LQTTKGTKTTYVYGASSNPLMVTEEKYSYETYPDIHIEDPVIGD